MAAALAPPLSPRAPKPHVALHPDVRAPHLMRPANIDATKARAEKEHDAPRKQSSREDKSQQRTATSRPRKLRMSSTEVHAALMAAQANTDWLADDLCTVCSKPVGALTLYCSTECRLSDGGVLGSQDGLTAPNHLTFFRRRSERSATSSSEDRRDSYSTTTVSESEAPTTPSPRNSVVARKADLPVFPGSCSSSFRTWSRSPLRVLRYPRRPSKAPLPPPVVFDAAAAPTFVRQRHSYAVGCSGSTPRPQELHEGTPLARSYAAPFTAYALPPVRRTSLTTIPVASSIKAKDAPTTKPFTDWHVPFATPTSPWRTTCRSSREFKQSPVAKRATSRPAALIPPKLSPLSSPTNQSGF